MQIETVIRRLSSIAVLLASISSTADSSDGPKAVVLRFCELDGAAARLSSTSQESPRLWKLTVGEIEPPEEPIILISGYKAEVIRTLSSRASVKVTYQVSGRLEPAESGFSFIKKSRAESVVVKLKQTSAGWRILRSSLSFPPHVTEMGIRRHFDNLISKHAVDEKQKENLVDILNQLSPVPRHLCGTPQCQMIFNRSLEGRRTSYQQDGLGSVTSPAAPPFLHDTEGAPSLRGSR